MAEIDFVALAKYCQNRYKEDLLDKQDERYVKTAFVSIDKNNIIKCSTVPDILSKSHQCILIHERVKKAVRNWYSWFKIEYLDSCGCVHDSRLDENFRLSVSWRNSLSNQVMFLFYGSDELFCIQPPFDEKFSKLWKLYSRLKDIKSAPQIKLISELYRKDEKILELEKENKDLSFSNILLEQEKRQYQEILDEIKKIVKKIEEPKV